MTDEQIIKAKEADIEMLRNGLAIAKDLVDRQDRKIDELQKQLQNVEHFLQAEIYFTAQRLCSCDKNPFFDGTKVGHKKSVKLLKNHIHFCERVLNLITKEREREAR